MSTNLPSFLKMPHPFPQIAEMLSYDDDELAEHLLRVCVTLGMLRLLDEAGSEASHLRLDDLAHVRNLLTLDVNEQEVLTEEMRTRLRSYETDWLRRKVDPDYVPF